MKVFVSADIEGVAGVVSWDQTLPDGRGYAQACEWMTDEVIAVCDAAIEAGAERVCVADSHLNGENINLDRLPDQVSVVRGSPRPHGMMQGMESGDFDVAICLGYHTGAHEVGTLNHTSNGAGFHALRLNGEDIDELDLYIRVASHFGTPVGLVTGDNKICASAARRYPFVETVVVKQAIGRMSAQTSSPHAGRELIHQQTKSVLSDVSRFRLIDVQGPFELEVDFKWHHPAEALAFLPSFERTGAQTVRFRGADILSIAKVVAFLSAYKLVPYP